MNEQAILYDYTGKAVSSAAAPMTGRPGVALSNPQGGLLMLGSDASGIARTPAIDSGGNLYATPTYGSIAVPIVINTVTGSPQNYAGFAALAWDSVNSRFTPIQVDGTGAVVTRASSLATATFAPSASVSTTATAGKSMMSFFNASTTNYQRILAFYAMCPPQSGVTSGLLGIGTSSTYTTVGFSVNKFTTAHTGGTVISGASHDTRDTYDTSLTCRTGATIAGQSATNLCVFDAAYNSTMGYGHREDPVSKVWTLSPGEGINISCISAVGGSGVSFYLRATLVQSTT